MPLPSINSHTYGSSSVHEFGDGSVKERPQSGKPAQFCVDSSVDRAENGRNRFLFLVVRDREPDRVNQIAIQRRDADSSCIPLQVEISEEVIDIPSVVAVEVLDPERRIERPIV